VYDNYKDYLLLLRQEKTNNEEKSSDNHKHPNPPSNSTDDTKLQNTEIDIYLTDSEFNIDNYFNIKIIMKIKGIRLESKIFKFKAIFF
jgi:hypothetical protein